MVAKNSKVVQAFQAAFPLTLPVLAGFSLLGIAYGILMESVGLGVIWTFAASVLVYAGSMQYVALTIFAAPFNPLAALFITFTVNARHLFYGLSILDKLENAGKYKPYIVFALSDEAFSLIYAHEPPENVEPGLFMFALAFLCQSYWVLASILGSFMGKNIPLNTAGLDFALTAMFVVIFLNQWEKQQNRASLLIGLSAALVALFFFGAENFVIPAMFLIVASLGFMQNRLVGSSV